jgi:hypothetical protein
VQLRLLIGLWCALDFLEGSAVLLQSCLRSGVLETLLPFPGPFLLLYCGGLVAVGCACCERVSMCLYCCCPCPHMSGNALQQWKGEWGVCVK